LVSGRIALVTTICSPHPARYCDARRSTKVRVVAVTYGWLTPFSV
jgi:hypothetical protein